MLVGNKDPSITIITELITMIRKIHLNTITS